MKGGDTRVERRTVKKFVEKRRCEFRIVVSQQLFLELVEIPCTFHLSLETTIPRCWLCGRAWFVYWSCRTFSDNENESANKQTLKQMSAFVDAVFMRIAVRI